MTRSIVALDLSLTSTGVCLPDGTPDRIRPRTVPKDDWAAQVDRLRVIRDDINTILDNTHPDLVLIEGYSYGSQSSQAHKIGELGGVVKTLLADRGQGWVPVPPKCRAKYATGRGNAGKSEVMLEVGRRFGAMAPVNEDEADALVIWAMGMDHYGAPPVKMPASHRVALEAIEWPF